MQPIRVLVVEDERIVALHLKQQLTKLGYAVIAVVASGEQALQFLRQAHPDVVLMDINIEGEIDGIQTAAMISAEDFTPVIYLTAYSEEATLQRAAATNAYGYLLKPFSERELHATLQMAIAHSATNRLNRQREQQLRDFAELSSDWFWELDDKLRFNWVSCQPELRARMGGVLTVGRPWQDMMLDEATDIAVEAHLKDLEQRRSFHDFRFVHQTGDDGPCHLIVNGIPIYDADGSFTGYRGTGRDITQQMLFLDELRMAKEEAETSSRAKSDFVANMSHEFRTPLNAILGFSQIIMDEVHGPVHPPQYREYGGFVHDAGNHLLGLVNNVLDLAKIEAGHMELRREGIDVAQLIAECCKLVDPLVKAGGVTLSDLTRPDLPVLYADAVRLKQIVLNLLSNAIKFTPSGGSITVCASTSNQQEMLIEVSDTGCGMPPEDVERAQEPFQRLEGAHTRRVEGTGLGLFLVKRLSELHGGKLNLTSQPGMGTTVRVSLPAERMLGQESLSTHG
ncbi:MAG TPA: ATP-binding protein [Dongiaceae bacterium]|nr:ATP-binding protein [Dongiaceae bacterium]